MNRVALVLGAGGTPGGFFIRAAMAAIGDRTGWEPTMCSTVFGTSAGALNAARIDAQPKHLDTSILDGLGELAQDLPAGDRSTGDRLVGPPRRLAGRFLGRFAPEGTNAPEYPVAVAPFHPAVSVVSCRRRDGVRRVTRLCEASEPSSELYASAAIPGFAPPVVIDGEPYVDGAIWSTTNADLVALAEHDLLIVVAPMVPKTGGSLAGRGHRASLMNELEPWRKAGKPVIYVAPTETALDQRTNHEAFAADAAAQIHSKT